MNCMDALDVLLTADLSLPANAQPALLREHLKRCGRCRTVAETLQSRTEALSAVATLVPMPPSAGTAFGTSPVPRLAVLAVAALAIFALVRGEPGGGDVATPPPAMSPTVVAEDPAYGLPEGRQQQLEVPSAPNTGTQSRPPRPLAPATGVSAPGAPSATGATPLTPATSTGLPGYRRIESAGTPIVTPGRLESVPLLLAADSSTGSGNAFAGATSTPPQGSPVLLAQSNPHITVFWVY